MSELVDKDNTIIERTLVGEILITTKTKFPEHGECAALDNVVIFFPGWPMDISQPVGEDLLIALANRCGRRAIGVSAFSDTTQVSEEQEIAAMYKRLEEMGVKKAAIVGHSYGTKRAMQMNAFAKQRRNMENAIDIQLLVLLNTQGLYDQNGILMGGKLLHNELMAVMHTRRIPGHDKPLAAFVRSMCVKFPFAQGHLVKFAQEEFRRVSTKEDHTQQVESPVLLVFSDHDDLADHTIAVPVDEELVHAKDGRVSARKQRERAARRYFPNALYLGVLVVKGLYHSGTVVQWYDQVAKLTARMISACDTMQTL